MHIILLSGGSGKRLWPLSNDIRSKQFIKFFKNEASIYESMVQRIYAQIKKIDKNATVTIATSKSQVSSIMNQLGDNVGVSVEPCRRDTFPAIALAASYLRDEKDADEEDVVIVCPVDPYVDEEYFKALKSLAQYTKNSTANLVLMGMEPTYPSEKYGYIIPSSQEKISKVLSFKEKPQTESAVSYISQGGLWNGGVFGFKLKYILNKAKQLLNSSSYKDLYMNYAKLEKISFDYAVVEHEDNIEVMRFNGLWKDLGTWNTLTESMAEHTIGKAMMNSTCQNVHIINDMDIPVLAMGLKDVVIAASPEGILVSDKQQSSYIKPFVDKINQQVMFAEKSWGSFKVLNIGKNSLTIKVTLNPGHKMNYHSHEKRNEVWIVTSGKGYTIIDGIKDSVEVGDVIAVDAGCKHTIIAESELQLIEVQLGKDINVSDKQKFNFD